MFYRKICFFVMVCGYYVSCAQENEIPNNVNSLTGNAVKHNKVLQTLSSRKTFSEIRNSEPRMRKSRNRRGIVMVDSDFDIPSEIYSYENNLHIDDVYGKNEGSGMDEFDAKESTETTAEDTEKEYDSETNTTNIRSLTKSLDLTQSSTKAMDITQPSAKTMEITQPSAKAMDITQPSAKAMDLTQSSAKGIDLTKPENNTIVASFGTEGSGDGILTDDENLITEISTQGQTRAEFDIPETPSEICVNSTCSLNELFVFSSEKRPYVPEGTNLTLTCRSSRLNGSMLLWYKNNGSLYFLQTFSTKEELRINVPDAHLMHSGLYMCVKKTNPQVCCNRQSKIEIYQAPLYRYHLMVIGLIALASLLLCVFLSVWRATVLRKYTKEFSEKHGNDKLKDQLL